MLISFILKSVGVSLSGVMAPGPITAVTILAGTKSKHAGAMVAIGHGIVEFPLMFLIMLGMGTLFENDIVKYAIGILGGCFLLFLGTKMLISIKKPVKKDEKNKSNDENSEKKDVFSKFHKKSPLFIGIFLSATNPYFLLWWATVGMAISKEALEWGVYAFAAFAIIHWLCDLIWLELLSFSSNLGSNFLNQRTERIILFVCAIVMLGFGLYFITDTMMA